MSRVDFYLISDPTPSLVACRLIEKAYQQGHRIFVYCNNQEEAEHLDELLWHYKDESFIPHHLQGEGPEPPPPVQIGYGAEPRGFNDVLLNLADTMPLFVSRFRRIIEIVTADETAKEISREHYRDYRSKRYELHTHVVA